MSAFPLVLIEWVDSARHPSEWVALDSIPAPYASKCVSVGYLIAENEHAKMVVPSIGDGDEPNAQPQIYGGMMIPVQAITGQRTLIEASS